MMIGTTFDTQLPPLDAAIDALNERVSLLESDPKLAQSERSKAFLGYGGDHAGSPLKEDALMICASVDEENPEYRAKILPLVQRMERFFSIDNTVSDFADEVRMLRAKRLIEHGRYAQADKVYRHIPYGPLYAQAFAQRNGYFLAAAKSHLHLFRKSSNLTYAKHQLLSALYALQYVSEYPHGDDIFLYQNAQALFSQNDYQEAKMQIFKICRGILPDHVHLLNQNEILATYFALLPYKYTMGKDLPELSHSQQLRNRLDRLQTVESWYGVVKMLQHQFVAKMFEKHQFHRPLQTAIEAGAHQLLDEPTSTSQHWQHFVRNTSLERSYIGALAGNKDDEQKLWEFLHPQHPLT